MTVVYLIGIGIVAMLLLQRFFGLHATLDGQLVANRKVPTQFVGLWMAVAFTFSTTLFFSGQLAYQYGWRGLGFYVVGNIGGLLLNMLIAQTILTPSTKYTIAEFVGQSYGENTRFLYAVSLTGIQALYALTLQFLAAGQLSSLIEGAPRETAIMTAAAVMLVLVVAGGLRASAVIDLIKGGVMIVLICAVVPLAFWRAGGPASLVGAVPQGGDIGVFVMGIGASLLISLLCGGPLDQSLYQRYFSVDRKKGQVRQLYLWAGVAFFALNIAAGATLGFLASNPALGVNVGEANLAGFATMAQFAPWGAVFLGIATIIIFVASGDTALNASSSLFVVDIYRRWRPHISEREAKLVQRGSMVVFIAVATFIALQKVDMLLLVVVVGAVRSALIVPILIAAWGTPERYKAVWQIALFSMAVSAALFLWQYKLAGSICGIVLTFVLLMAFRKSRAPA